MHKRIEDLEQEIKKLRKENSDLADSRDIYKKELDNLTFEYDKLSREARNAKQDKTKLEKKLKKSINEFIVVQEEKAIIEREKESLQTEMIQVRESARKEISQISQVKLRLEQDLLIQQQKTAQIFVDYEAHRKLIKVVGGVTRRNQNALALRGRDCGLELRLRRGGRRVPRENQPDDVREVQGRLAQAVHQVAQRVPRALRVGDPGDPEHGAAPADGAPERGSRG